MEFSSFDWYTIWEAFRCKPIQGFLYAVEYEDGAVKIGYTQNATERFYRLQNYYRGRKSKIIKTCIGGKVQDCRVEEYKATFGLKACEKREIFPITFEQAVERIQAATPEDSMFLTSCRKETVGEFPCLGDFTDRCS